MEQLISLFIGLFKIVVIVVTTVAGWITAIRLRRRVRRALGKEATDTNLTSFNMWMRVDEAEERKRGGKLS
jgi:hypothetical protein